MQMIEKIVIYVLSFFGVIGFGYIIIKFFKWTEILTREKSGEQNTVLGYNIAFDFLAWSVTFLIIIISFIIYLTGYNKELATIILGTAIGSAITRTPSFKEKDKK